MSRAGRQKAERRGHRAESLAALYLRLKLYRILERRVRNPAGEIDIVARKGSVIAFVEVKARTTRDAALASISVNSRRRIARAAEIWLGQRPGYTDFGSRLDVVAIVPWRWPMHIRDAWRPDFAARDV